LVAVLEFPFVLLIREIVDDLRETEEECTANDETAGGSSGALAATPLSTGRLVSQAWHRLSRALFFSVQTSQVHVLGLMI
jgi:hypothetical protein